MFMAETKEKKNPLHQHSQPHLHKTRIKFIEMKTERREKNQLLSSRLKNK